MVTSVNGDCQSVKYTGTIGAIGDGETGADENQRRRFDGKLLEWPEVVGRKGPKELQRLEKIDVERLDGV
jgi:hypothetical protein